MTHIRNFCILAHIDHGKSTLADRFLELTATIEKRKMREQYLDMHPLERERGITIRLQPVRMEYKLFTLNLIDTPGHVDFSYEVSRSLAAVEGAILLVDASQGIQAQTVANFELAKLARLAVIPVVNKIDLKEARVEETASELSNLAAVRPQEVFRISGKTGEGVEALLGGVLEQIPPPAGNPDAPLRALIFDSHFDPYKGVVAYVRIVDGSVRQGEKIVFMAREVEAEALEVGIFRPELESREELAAGEIGYIATGMKDPGVVRVGETITNLKIENWKLKIAPLAGYFEPQPMVFASFYPQNADDFPRLEDALKKLKLNDAALTFAPEASQALGRGFRCGFLGMLHLDIVAERLKREYQVETIITIPTVAYREQEEPWVSVDIITPAGYLGPVMRLLDEFETIYKTTDYLSEERSIAKFEMPLRELIVDFYDRLKSISSGYASMDYRFLEYRPAKLVTLDILVAQEKVDALSRIVPETHVSREGRKMVERLKELLPKQLFPVAIQAAVGGKILARADIPSYRKDVTAKLYGGDRTRKDKLLQKQKKGKKRMKLVGRVEIPQEAFLLALKI
ncbi:GTP-binding protein [Candidatus Azambacteria bacterium]|nr:GTP-binding protein [Candidatus Azambacteria bacterium]